MGFLMIVRISRTGGSACSGGSILASAGVTRGQARFFARLCVQGSLHGPCRREFQALGGSDLDRLAGIRVATLPRAALCDLELAEAENRNFLAISGSISD